MLFFLYLSGDFLKVCNGLWSTVEMIFYSLKHRILIVSLYPRETLLFLTCHIKYKKKKKTAVLKLIICATLGDRPSDCLSKLHYSDAVCTQYYALSLLAPTPWRAQTTFPLITLGNQLSSYPKGHSAKYLNTQNTISLSSWGHLSDHEPGCPGQTLWGY